MSTSSAAAGPSDTAPPFAAALIQHPCFVQEFAKFGFSESGNACSEQLRSFCAIKFRVPTPSNNVHGSLNWFGCVDLTGCKSVDQILDEVISQFCEIPSCTVYAPNSSERSFCTVVQSVGCSLDDRYRVSEDLELALLCSLPEDEVESPPSPTVLGDSDNLITTLRKKHQIISTEVMDSILQCGVQGYLNDLPSFMYSGISTSLGAYDQCIKHHKNLILSHQEASTGSGVAMSNRQAILAAEHKYCVIELDSLAHQGVCLPKTCEGSAYKNVLDFVCDQIRPDEIYGYRGSETCLDYIDLIPLPTCIMVQLIGCNQTLVDADASSFDVQSLFVSGVGADAGTRSFNPKTINYEWSAEMPNFADRNVYHSLVDILHRDAHRKVSARKLLGGQRGGFSNHNFTASSSSGWMDWEDTISKFRYESPLNKKVRVRCGGWTETVDDSQFNKTAGVLLSLFVILLPLFPPVRKVHRGVCGKLCAVFATYATNLKRNMKLMLSRANKQGSGDFAHVCGFRTLSMFWIIVGHTFTFSWREGVDREFKQTLNLIHDFNFQLVIAAQLAVDTFFLIAGLMFGLFSATRIEQIVATAKENNKTIHRPLIFAVKQSVKRYVRIVPTVAVILAISYWIIPYLGNGPMWITWVDYLRYGEKADRQGGCYVQWWKLLLMFNNLDKAGLSCLGHTWFLANDLQFYIMSNFLLLFCTWAAWRNDSSSKLRRKPLYLSVLVVFAVCSLVSYRSVVNQNLHFAVPGFSDQRSADGSARGSQDLLLSFTEFYVKPWCRVGPYLVGLVTAILYRDGVFKKFISHGSPGQAPQTHTPERSPLMLARVEDASPLTHRRAEAAAETPRPTTQSYRELTADSTSDGEDAAILPSPDLPLIYGFTVLSFLLIWICVFTLPYSANLSTQLVWNSTLDHLWLVYNRTVWAIGCAWLLLVLVYVSAPQNRLLLLRPIRSLLCSKPMTLCSIFTFTFYLVHPLVQQFYYASRTSDLVLNNMVGWFASVGHYTMTSVYGVLASLMIEVPLGYLAAAIGL